MGRRLGSSQGFLPGTDVELLVKNAIRRKAGNEDKVIRKADIEQVIPQERSRGSGACPAHLGRGWGDRGDERPHRPDCSG